MRGKKVCGGGGGGGRPDACKNVFPIQYGEEKHLHADLSHIFQSTWRSTAHIPV